MMNQCILANHWVINQLGGVKKKWNTLSHNGVLFPAEYEKHNIPVLYKGQEIILENNAEELATLYAKYIESVYVKNKIFNKNFWNGWRAVLGPNHIIKDLENVDFRRIYEYLLLQKEKKKNIDKTQQKELEKKYETAIVDGKPQSVGNYRVEPPGIFIGRGCNLNLGKIKRRIYPEDVTINIGKESPIPEPMIGHKWGKIVHDKTVEWLASWKDNITGKIKYVWLGANSEMKAKNDESKFNLARKLKRKIKEIRKINSDNLSNPDPNIRQISTALYFIDNFALRVGNEKGEDETDTVGVTSLRVEHIKLLDDNRVELDFLGKDSVRYNRILPVDSIVYQNLKEFINDKSPQDQLFNLINSSDVNKYLQSFMKNLTAKVFRTYNASYLFQKELKRIDKKYQNYSALDKLNLLLDDFNKANAKVAMLCNHQKNITQSTNKQLEKINELIKKNKKKLKEARSSKKKNTKRISQIESLLRKLKSKKILKMELKNISLGTSKINYIDPRITIAFLKRNNIPVDKIFSKTLQEKFKWASDVDTNFVF